MSILEGGSVLITGGAGSFGQKCVELLLREVHPKQIVVFSRDEQKHLAMRRSGFSTERFPQLRYVVGDIRDISRVLRTLSGVDFVIHAAAMKQVDVAEYNPQECIRTNVFGAENLIDACLDAGVRKLVALSSDKAASPVNLYGATKLCADKLFVAANSHAGRTGTRFAVARYGNVLGSSGSVVPFFQKERSKGVLPITDERMTRFMITMEAGVRFVINCFEWMSGGEIFVPRIPSARIPDIAKAVAPECRTNLVGIRPGEKLHECMIPAEESRQTLEYADRFVIEPAFSWWKASEDLAAGVARRCEDGFCYSSDKNTEWLSVPQLRKMIAQLPTDHAGELLTALRIAG